MIEGGETAPRHARRRLKGKLTQKVGPRAEKQEGEPSPEGKERKRGKPHKMGKAENGSGGVSVIAVVGGGQFPLQRN